MSVARDPDQETQFDYAAVGHVTVDVMPDGTRRPGGTAFYSALQAARLGLRAAIFTRGVPDEIADVLGRHREELELLIEPAAETTTLATAGSDAERTQRVLAWAGPISPRPDLSAGIVHLAPVARELDADWLDGSWLDADPAPARFVGLTPQGLLRSWHSPGDSFVLSAPPRAPAVVARCQAVVVSEHEQASCQALIDEASRGGASVAITAGQRTTRVIAHGETVEVAPEPVADARDDLGAGDVFAAAFFIALHKGLATADAAAYANAAAAVRVSGTGAQAIGRTDTIHAWLRGER